ncbi:MAG: hypothetical protein H6713_11465 [Myxococcales bacterium]|nr:hypothetical protein [Myxococcales bacterium]
MVCRPDARPRLFALAAACLGAACYMPNPAFQVTTETDSGGGSNSGTVGTTAGSSPSATDDPTTPATSSDPSASTSVDVTVTDSTTSPNTTGSPTSETTETGVSDSLTDSASSSGTETGEPLDPPTCDAFNELPEVTPLAMELSIMNAPVADCMQVKEYTGWQYPLPNLDPGVTGLGFHDMQCTEGVLNLGPTHKLTGYFPEELAPVWSNAPEDFNAVECVTVRVEWGPIVEGECSIRSVGVWRHRNPEIEFFKEPTPLWAAASNYPTLNLDDHPLGPLAPIEWAPAGECLCVPEQQENSTPGPADHPTAPSLAQPRGFRSPAPERLAA